MIEAVEIRIKNFVFLVYPASKMIMLTGTESSFYFFEEIEDGNELFPTLKFYPFKEALEKFKKLQVFL